MQVRINIRGRQYTVRGDRSGEDIESIAKELDQRLEDVAGRTSSFDEYTVAVLTALNLVSELHRLRIQVQGQLDGLDREVASVAAVLEAALPAQDEA